MKAGTTLLSLFLLCLMAAWLALACGPAGFEFNPFAANLDNFDIIMSLRAPRMVLAAIVGASLAICGLSMQTWLNNDLADPWILGLSGGAASGAVLSLVLFPDLPAGPGAALGTLLAAWLVWALNRGQYQQSRLLLAGFTTGSLLSSLTGLILVLNPSSRLMRSATFWLFGGLGIPVWLDLLLPGGLFVLSLAWMLFRSGRFDRLTLGADTALSLGVDIKTMQRGILITTVSLAAAVVSVSGLIGFVGLLAPHVARRLVGGLHHYLILASACCGALMCLLADTIARTAFSPHEVPIGLVTSIIGGPFFLYLLRRLK
jgi:iron complex transport system permease protein